MKMFMHAAIRCAVMSTAVTASLLSVRAANAYTITLDQVGSNVVATGTGAINLTGLTFTSFVSVPAFIRAEAATISVARGMGDGYRGFSGPSNFGSGSDILASTSSGDFVGIDNFFAISSVLWVPEGYVSGNLLSSSATWRNATFASLGVTPGTYIWRWGTGLENQNFTLIIGGVGVLDGGTTIFLLSFALLSLAALRRKLRW